MLVCSFKSLLSGKHCGKQEEKVPQMALFNDFVCLAGILIHL